MILQKLSSTVVAACAIVALSGCVYRMDIPQGNDLKASVIQQLQVGMSRNQVEFLMGSPAIVDLYRPGEWHYIYYHKNGTDGTVEKQQIKLTFTGDLLAVIDTEVGLN